MILQEKVVEISQKNVKLNMTEEDEKTLMAQKLLNMLPIIYY